MSYIIHLRLEEFRVQATQDLRVQDYRESKSIGVHDTQATSLLVMTGRDAVGQLHAARIVVERASLFGEEKQALRERMHRNVEAAQGLVERALGGPLQGGIQLVPGLWDDLGRFGCEHELWRWEKDGETYRLVPGSE